MMMSCEKEIEMLRSKSKTRGHDGAGDKPCA